MKSINYRRDIDGLRAIAVLAVFFFHLEYLPNGYLGVDIFFVISGYLITKIIHHETIIGNFSIIQFYIRRIRRIIPLVLCTTSVSMVIGLVVMLPDDLENLSQSVFATNIFANNILLLITTGDYWDIVNNYKPLMHTWSLGVEEQFYMFYPLIFMFLKEKNKRWVLPIILLVTIVSFLLFVTSSDEASKFYLIQYRFFELSLGGLGAIVFKKNINYSYFNLLSVFIIITIILFDLNLSNDFKLILIVFATVGLLISNNNNSINSYLLDNILFVWIGKISFSLYMWHQIVLAFTRYFIKNKLEFLDSFIIFVLVIVLSTLSYYYIEQPARDKNRISNTKLLFLLGIIYVAITSFSLYIYSVKGIIKDVPELEYKKSTKYEGNIHIKYNERIYNMNKMFSSNKVKVLIVGNSFARDWANILLESKLKQQIEISYVSDIDDCKDINIRFKEAKYIFFSELNITDFLNLLNKHPIDPSKCWNVGTKNFGPNNGIHYNKRGTNKYCFQRTKMDPGFFTKNQELKKQWKNKYIDLITMVVDVHKTVPVFTSDCKFISQDGRHLTPPGALFFAQISNLDSIIVD